MTTFTDDVRQAVSPHKFGGDRMAAACYLQWLDGCADEQTGSTDDWHWFISRHGRRLCYSDDQGNVGQETFSDEARAMVVFAGLDEEYGEVLQAQEEADDAWSDGYRPEWVGPVDCPVPGEVVSIDGEQGFAFLVLRLPERKLSDYEWSGLVWQHPGRRIVRMVGDDREFEYPVDVMTPLGDDDYCWTCGQIGCGWH